MKKKATPLEKPKKEKKPAAPVSSPKVVKEIDKNQDPCMQIGKFECQLLRYLYKVNMVTNLKELAEVLKVAHSRITHIMDHLVERKLVHRRPSEEDRRCWIVSITDEGKKLIESSK